MENMMIDDYDSIVISMSNAKELDNIIKNHISISIKGFEIAGELSKAGYRLLIYIFKNLEVNCPKINLSNIKICKELNEKYSYVITNAKKELINKHIIKLYNKGKFGEYLINVNLFFKGSPASYLNYFDGIYADELIEFITK